MIWQFKDPSAEIRKFHNHFGRRYPGIPVSGYNTAKNSWYIPLDAVEDKDDFLVHASVPGLKPEDIEVTIEDGILSINGETKEDREDKESAYLIHERRRGSFHRSIRLPKTVDSDKAETDYENGVLTIKLPKLEAKKAKRLEIVVKK